MADEFTGIVPGGSSTSQMYPRFNSMRNGQIRSGTVNIQFKSNDSTYKRAPKVVLVA